MCLTEIVKQKKKVWFAPGTKLEDGPGWSSITSCGIDKYSNLRGKKVSGIENLYQITTSSKTNVFKVKTFMSEKSKGLLMQEYDEMEKLEEKQVKKKSVKYRSEYSAPHNIFTHLSCFHDKLGASPLDPVIFKSVEDEDYLNEIKKDDPQILDEIKSLLKQDKENKWKWTWKLHQKMSDLTNAIKKCVVLNSDVPEEWKIWTNKDDFENKSKTGKKSIPKYLLSDLG